MEQITAFQEAMEGNVYLSFSEKSLYVTCSQLRNPFHIYIDIPVEEQRQKIAGDTAILRSAKEILIIEPDKAVRNKKSVPKEVGIIWDVRLCSLSCLLLE